MPPHGNDNDMIGLLGRLTLDNDGVKQVPLPLTGVGIEAEVVDFIAEVKLSQCYENTESVPLEATYHFPVDQAAAVCGFQAEYEDGTIVKGVVKEKAKAREEYKQAMSQGKQANLLEATKRDIFTLNVGNVPAGGFVKIVITYVTTLKAQDDAAAFVLPTYIAPRYSPRGSSMSPDEAQAESPPTSSIKMFGLDINIRFNCRSDIKLISSPTHPFEPTFSSRVYGKTGSVSLSDIAMDRDLAVHVLEEHPHQPRAIIELCLDKKSMAGFVTLFPEIEFKDLVREFIFVVDRSGSMNSGTGGGKNQISHASDALLLFLRALPPSCTFNIVGFGSRFVSLFPNPQPDNDETLEEASRYAMNMKANMGGTEIKAPLQHVLGQKCPPQVQRQVFVLTDGQVSNDSQVFDVIRQQCSNNSSKCRLFSLGIGNGVSRHLVEGMAHAGRGTARFVEGGDASSLRVKVLGQLKQALQPALDDVSIEWNFPTKPSKAEEEPKQNAAPPVKTLLGYRSPSADEAPEAVSQKPRSFPSVNPPVFNKERYLSFVIFPAGSTDMPESATVKCNSPDGPLEHTIQISDDEVFHGTIAHKMAARAAISEYEDSKKSGHGGWRRSSASVTVVRMITDAEALQMALDHSLVSEKTSFIAVRQDPLLEAGAEPTKHIVIPQCVAEPLKEVEERRHAARSGKMSALCNMSASRVGGFFAGSARGREGGELVSRECSIPSIGGGMRGVRDTSGGAFAGVANLRRSKASFKRHDMYAKCCVEEDAHDVEDAMMVECLSVKKRAAKSSLTVRGKMRRKAKPQSAKKKKTANGASLPESTSSVSSDDRIMQLCLLQKADGSFPFDNRLSDAMGISLSAMSSMAVKLRETMVFGNSTVATVLAVAAMRGLFASSKDVWELQEGKAMSFLMRGLTMESVDKLVGTMLVQLCAQTAQRKGREID